MAEIEAYVRLQRRNRRNVRQFRPRIQFVNVRDMDFVSRYRVDRATAQELIEIVGQDLSRGTQGGHSIPPDTQLLLSLRYLAKGAFYSEVADTHGVSRSTVCRVIGRVVNSINANIDNIRFPTQPQSLLQTKREFYRKCSLPNIVGAIDGTLVPIVAPTENEEVYVCRKGFHALNCQAVSSPDLKFLDVVARWPGSTHDSAIFENSRLKDYLDNHDGMILLGDSGYALMRYLLTPIPAPRNEQEHLYNRRHRQGRLCIERTFGLLKSRFRCLHKTGGVLPFKPQKCASVFVACCRLHNLCLQNGLPDPPELDLEEDHDQEVDAPDNNLGGQAVRNQFVQIR